MNRSMTSFDGSRIRATDTDREAVRRELARDITAMNRRMLEDMKNGLLRAARGEHYGKSKRR